MASMIRVELDMSHLAATARTEAMFQFAIRRQLASAGIPLGPFGSSAPARGVLSWRDDWDRDVRIVEWNDDEAKLRERNT
jgi:hypothetical protein